MEITVKTLTKWPEKDPLKDWKTSPFKKSALKTLPALGRELRMVGARNAVLYTMHPANAVTRDGSWIRSDARQPPDPGVIVAFEKRAVGEWVELRFPCRTFKQWEDNLRAITLALEGLRMIDRYGVTTGAQYTGYKALPPAEPGTQGQSPEQAAEFIAQSAGMPEAAEHMLTRPAFAELVYKAAAKELHPDKGGDAAQFQKLESSMRLVRENGKATDAGPK